MAVCGGQFCEEPFLGHAEEAGRAIGKAGATLICGGLTGVMEAACRGAAERGGTSIGVLPGSDPGSANPWVTHAIATGIGHARNLIIVNSADAVIAIDGEYGTLSEIAFAVKLGRPIVGVGTWSLIDPGGSPAPIHTAPSGKEAVAMALKLIEK
ncbi:MAG: TIGR00725 family protein [Acidobacteria bacterium]|nr:MAG: TIGR00725 family protein [Acidobacteriota bacterium]